jgi:type II secretory pathway pseudopilin PulG
MKHHREFGIRSSEFGVEETNMHARIRSSVRRRSIPHSALRTPNSEFRAGFTLVEMLVAVGLVILMMSLFTTIFQFATQAMAVQKGTAENDQKVRLVMTLLRGDIGNRTTKTVLPYLANNPTDIAYLSDERMGYLYISENDPDDDTDDILQFTISSSNADELIYGRAAWLTDPNGMSAQPNQPEFDDSVAKENSAGSSANAEVSYFLRNGVLYRRILLLRQPIVAVNIADAHPYNPKLGPLGNGSDMDLTVYQGGNTGPKANFYSDFDYSAHYDGTGPAFHGVLDLTNTPGGAAFPLGKPNYRFGFNQANGLPREFTTQHIDNTGTTIPNSPRFFGRFTQAETSYFVNGSSPFVSFGYPARVTADSPNPYDDPGRTITFDTRTGRISEYSTGSRIAEDILMTSVQRFDIKVFDPLASLGPDGFAGSDGDDNGAGGSNDLGELGWPGSDDGGFVDLGHNGFIFNGSDQSVFSSTPSGNSTGNAVNLGQSPSYRPSNPLKPGTFLYRFDTWHPQVNLDATGATFDHPPFRCTTRGVDNQPGVAGFDDDGISGVDDQGELGWPGSDDVRFPLRAIQIRITFFDQTSQQLRDVTFVQSLQ